MKATGLDDGGGGGSHLLPGARWTHEQTHKRQVPTPAKLAPAPLPIATAVRRVWVVAPLQETHLKEAVQTKISSWGKWTRLAGDGEPRNHRSTTKSHLHAASVWLGPSSSKRASLHATTLCHRLCKDLSCAFSHVKEAFLCRVTPAQSHAGRLDRALGQGAVTTARRVRSHVRVGRAQRSPQLPPPPPCVMRPPGPPWRVVGRTVRGCGDARGPTPDTTHKGTQEQLGVQYFNARVHDGSAHATHADHN